jgi:hypothetical protein
MEILQSTPPCVNIHFSVKRLLTFLIYVFFIGYIAFIPSGPFPIYVWGTKLDTLFGVLLLLLLLMRVRKRGQYPRGLIGITMTYLTICLISTVFSYDPLFSIHRWIITLSYALVCFLAPVVVYPKIRFIRVVLLVVAVMVSILILIMFKYYDFGQVSRFALGISPSARQLGKASVDPNMTAIGLMMSIVIYLPNLYKKKFSLLCTLLEFCAFSTIIIAVVITLSRTAIVAFGIASIVASFLLLLNKCSFTKLTKKFRYVAFILLCLVFISVGVNKFVPAQTDWVIKRITNASYDETRINLIHNSIKLTFESCKSLFIGQGYFTTNPHNEPLRNLSSSGVFGLVGFFAFLLVFYLLIVKPIKQTDYLFFGARFLYFYILFAIQTYGHTKSMWTAFMFLLIFYLENKSMKENRMAVTYKYGKEYSHKSARLSYSKRYFP